MDIHLDENSADCLDVSDVQLFQQYYSKTYDSAYQAAYQILQNHWIAEDVASQTFLKLYQKFSLYHTLALPQFKALIKVSARNEAIDYLRRMKTSETFLSVYQNIHTSTSVYGLPEQEILSQEENLNLQKAFHCLPASYQKILNLKYAKGLSVTEIAKELNITVKNAEVRLQRARNKLRTLLNSALVAAIIFLIISVSDGKAGIKDYFISPIATTHFFTTAKRDELPAKSGKFICEYIPAGYVLTEEGDAPEASYYQYTNPENQRIFLVSRMYSGMDYELTSETHNVEVTEFDSYYAIYMETKFLDAPNEFLWYDKKNGYVYSIIHYADMEEMKEIAKYIYTK